MNLTHGSYLGRALHRYSGWIGLRHLTHVLRRRKAMSSPLLTTAELRAQEATALSAFSGINLVKIRSEVAEALSHFGRLGIFHEYTKHDISHVDGMLRLYDWLIPEETRKKMSSADWLLLTLATYFHDFGLLVTGVEYDRRKSSGFDEYVGDLQRAGSAQDSDYRSRVGEIGREEDREKFLYQEFVRENHPKRIRSWIVGEPDASLGFDPGLVDQLRECIGGVGQPFLKDLALVCESHHLADLNDTGKYRVDRPYGQDEDETANVQFTAIMLRSADLLHIRRDRAPSVAMRFINPSNPISQVEWAKQNAVVTVRSMPARNSDGQVNRQAPRDTIEVHAEFTEEEGFFALTSYLRYADAEIKQNYRWAEASNINEDAPHRFPWKAINADSVVADGFITEPFEFQIDQHKVLNLLTGHTLYNNSNVAVREIVQNAIDAVRLRQFLNDVSYSPEVEIHWSPERRVLEVVDNGTGMTQAEVEGNFLRVGSSRYQDPQFRRQNPNFTSISRFGIGVLSAFMVADEVRVITCHPQEEKARELTLRSVHGKYLIRLMSKDDEQVPALSRAHGTSVRMRIRPSAKLGDVEKILRHWIIVPRCDVRLYLSDDPSCIRVGFGSVEDALKSSVESWQGGTAQVRTGKLDYGQMAYVTRWSKIFKQSSILPYQFGSRFRSRPSASQNDRLIPPGTCVEGIRVTTSPPGYSGSNSVWALVDVTNNDAIRTNVARTGIEPSEAFRTLSASVQSALVEHINEEIRSLHLSRGFSATRAAAEADHLTQPILQAVQRGRYPRTPDGMDKVTAYLIESDEGRHLVSLAELAELREIAALEGPLTSRTETFLASLPTQTTLRSLLGFAGMPGEIVPDVPLLCSWSPSTLFGRWLLDQWEISEISPKLNGEILEVRFRPRDELVPRWICSSSPTSAPVSELTDRLLERSERASGDNIWIMNRGVQCDIDERFESVAIGSELFMLGSHPLRSIKAISQDVSDTDRLWLGGLIAAVAAHKSKSYGPTIQHAARLKFNASRVHEVAAELDSYGFFDLVDRGSVLDALGSISGSLYDCWRSYRREYYL
ncbi:ATP-binding protein [Micromonospora sp. NPDC092111]|uniref:HD domain-containing protein n=1 Tax=Micromonospora sp. NPDC092111 TaxID=3364289 RepID=UPI003812DB80